MTYVADDIVERLCQSSGTPPLDNPQAPAPIGVFQSFRPSGLPESLSAGLSARSMAFTARLDSVYNAVRSSQRLDNMSEALYFIACDRLLRDYLRWPLLDKDPSGCLAEKDSLRDYFALWKHGIKLRIFNNRQLDVYLPR